MLYCYATNQQVEMLRWEPCYNIERISLIRFLSSGVNFGSRLRGTHPTVMADSLSTSRGVACLPFPRTTPPIYHTSTTAAKPEVAGGAPVTAPPPPPR
jgi:hypothetical protein